MRDRDPRINLPVCIGHCAEEAFEALDAYDKMKKMMGTELVYPDPRPEWLNERNLQKAIDNVMEETADLIYAARRLAFYVKAENKLVGRTSQTVLVSISENYINFGVEDFRKLPHMDALTCAIGIGIYSQKTLRTLGVGYPKRGADFANVFDIFLVSLRGTMRLMLLEMIPELEEAKFVSENWRDELQGWIDLKIERKRNADRAEGHEYYDGGY